MGKNLNSFFLTYHLVQDMSRKLGPNSRKVFSTNTLRKAEDLMPRDIMSSEPRHWMVLGQLAMPVQCLGSDDTMSLGIKSSAFLSGQETDPRKVEVRICVFSILSSCKTWNLIGNVSIWVDMSSY